MRRGLWALGLGGCVLSDAPRTLNEEELIALLADEDVRAAVLEALGEEVVTPTGLDAALAGYTSDADLAQALAEYPTSDDLTDTLEGYATAEDLAAVEAGALPADQVDCAAGAYVSGWDSAGHAVCTTPLSGVSCASGAVAGFDGDGEPVCAALITADVDAASVAGDLVEGLAGVFDALEVGLLTVTDAVEGGDAGLVLRGPARFEPGEPADGIRGDADPSTSGWVQVATSSARRGTLVHAVRTEGTPDGIRVGLDYDDAVGTPDMGGSSGQGIWLEVTAFVASASAFEGTRCQFGLVRATGGAIVVEQQGCDAALGGSGMSVAVLSPVGPRAATGFDLEITRTISEPGAWLAFQIDFLTAFPAYDWRFKIAP